MSREEDRKTYEGGRGHGHGDMFREDLSKAPDMQLLFVGSVNCTRHKPFMQIGALMREGRASMLCPTMTDFSTGRYLHQVYDAIVELSEERHSKNFELIYGCQWVILSSDEELLSRQLMEEHGIRLWIRDDSHLVYGDHA